MENQKFGIGQTKGAFYRILTENYHIKYAGTDQPSWLTLETAKKLVNYDSGEMIYEYNKRCELLWEVL